MTQLKTTANDQDVIQFLNTIPDEQKRKDAFTLLELMKRVTGADAKMWGDAIVGFGHYHYKYESGREGDWFLVGFSPRKQNLTLYIVGGFAQYDELLSKLGKHSIGKGCLYIKRVSDVNLPTLESMIEQSVKQATKTV